MARSRHVRCPMCGDSIEWEDNFKIGDIAYCSDCDEELKVVSIDPPQLKRMVELLEVSNGSYKGFHDDFYNKEFDDFADDFNVEDSEVEG